MLGLALLLFVALGALAEAAQRGVRVQLRAGESPSARLAETIQLYERSYALVIGNDKYDAGWPLLSSAVKDARAVAAELGKRGFDVTLKTNLASFELKQALEEFFIVAGDDPKARLFVWFAGHGHTLAGEGFIVPVDAPRPEAGMQFRLKALSLHRFGEYVRLARAKHAYVVFDSCFAGTVFDSRRALPPPAVTRATTLPVRQFLTSGDIGQTVSDDGTFRSLFLRALTGDERADANGDGYLTASELGLFLSARVTNLTQSRQTPRYGKLRDAAYDRGDFVFVLPGAAKQSTPATAPAVPGSDSSALEITFWTSVKDSDNPAALQAYLARYPNGVFTQLAMLRIQTLEDAAKTVSKKVAVAVPENPAAKPSKNRVAILPLRRKLQVSSPTPVYREPEARAEVFWTLGRGRELLVTGQSEDGQWLRVRLPNRQIGFIKTATWRASPSGKSTARSEASLYGPWSGFVPECGLTIAGTGRELNFRLRIEAGRIEGKIRSVGSIGMDYARSLDGSGRLDDDLGLQFSSSDNAFIVHARYEAGKDRFVGRITSNKESIDCEIEFTRN